MDEEGTIGAGGKLSGDGGNEEDVVCTPYIMPEYQPGQVRTVSDIVERHSETPDLVQSIPVW